jgi:LPPG:FO 2-phospho-L-lactate transferase
MIVERAEGPVEAVELRGVERARPTADVLAVLAEAEAIVIGPSNPVISIGPILALPGMREAVAGSPAPVVAVSPFVGGYAIKGPTDEFCRHVGIELSASGVATAYEGLIDGLVADEEAEGAATLVLDTLMRSQEDRVRVARRTLEFADSLSG